MNKILLLTFFLYGCGWGPFEAPKTEINEMKERKDLYCEMSRPIYIENGEEIDKHCDSALFTSLHGLSCDYVDVKGFEIDNTGKLTRKKTHSCLKKGSDSEFSKDMALGMILYFAFNPDKELATRVYNYGNDNKWLVCDAKDDITKYSKCLMTPEISFYWSMLSQASLTENKGFAAHLDVLVAIAQYKITGGLTNKKKDDIKAHYKREPENLLFHAAYAKFISKSEEDLKIVADKALQKFPSERLPNSSDWCEPYLWQRDTTKNNKPNPDWQPCPKEGKIHTGTDFLMVSWLLDI